MSARRAVALALAAVVAAGAGACSGEDGDPSADVDRDLVRDLRSTSVTLYLPELRGSRPERVEVDAGSVRIDYDRDPAWTAILLPAPGVPDARLCDELGWSVAEGYSCTATGGVVRASFEEMSYAAVVRGDTLLEGIGLVTEADPGLLEDAVAALQDAPEVSADDLARY